MMRLALCAALLAACALAGYTPMSTNPYTAHKKVYVPSTYKDEVETSIAKHPALKCKFEKVATYPTYIWLDTIAKISTLETHMDNAKAEGSMVQLVIYDLPNRDCSAAASNGELTIANDGLNKYKTQYIDAIATILKKYPTVPVVMVIEPDSLPNMVTNYQVTKCAEAQAGSVYEIGVAYAISKLAGSLRYMYIDAAHECWLGWTNNMNGFVTEIQSMLARVTDTSSIRGFASNTANYQNVHLFSGNQGCGDSNPELDNAMFVKDLSALFVSKGVFTTAPPFIIDTSRNGVKDTRSSNSNWCNIKNTGLGPRPAAGCDGTISACDAFVWVKTPGESDGTSDSSATRYDYHCGSVDSLPNAPEAGQWFDSQFMYLVGNATPAITCGADSSATTVSSTGGQTSSGGTTTSSTTGGTSCVLSSVPDGASGWGTCQTVAAGKTCALNCDVGYTAVKGACSSSGQWKPRPICQQDQGAASALVPLFAAVLAVVAMAL